MATCSFCNGKVGLVVKFKLSDGLMCDKCLRKYADSLKGCDTENLFGSMSYMSVDDFKKRAEAMSEACLKPESFTPNRTVGGYIDFDDNQRLIYIRGGLSAINRPKEVNPKYIRMGDVIECEIVEDGGVTTNTGLLGGAVGGALFGGAGAVVGTMAGKKSSSVVNNISVSIVTNDPLNTRAEVPIIKNGKCKKTSLVYSNCMNIARDILASLTVIIKDNMSKQSASGNDAIVMQNQSSADEIRKYKQLLDDGIISQEEFEAKKKSLLGI